MLLLAPPAWAEAPIAWVEGFEQGLAEARTQQRPAFVYFDAHWCSWCQRYKTETLADARVRERLTRDYVAVLVDFDARADLAARYRIRGLPYTLILSPTGKTLNGFVGLLTPVDMRDVLDHFVARATPAETFPDAEVQVRVRSLDAAGYRAFHTAFLEHVANLYDAERGTLARRFDTGATLKRPSPLTWMYLADVEPWHERARRAARAEYRHLHDPVGGGFFNFLDLSQPGREYTESSKLLEGNAWLSAWLAHAGAGDDAELKRAATSGWQFLRERLWDTRDRGFWQAQVADQRYYALPVWRRWLSAPPPIDRLKRADTNAQAAWALVQYARATGDQRALDYAASALDYVLTTLWHQGRLYHYWRNGTRSTPDVPIDWFWVLGAGAELEAVRPESLRRQRLQKISVAAATWLRHEMRKPQADVIDPELAGLIAWVAPQRSLYPQLPPPARDWALRRLHLRADTAPDDVVFGLRAWERMLKQNR